MLTKVYLQCWLNEDLLLYLFFLHWINLKWGALLLLNLFVPVVFAVFWVNTITHFVALLFYFWLCGQLWGSFDIIISFQAFSYFFWRRSCFLSQAGLELEIFLLQPPHIADVTTHLFNFPFSTEFWGSLHNFKSSSFIKSRASQLWCMLQLFSPSLTLVLWLFIVLAIYFLSCKFQILYL